MWFPAVAALIGGNHEVVGVKAVDGFHFECVVRHVVASMVLVRHFSIPRIRYYVSRATVVNSFAGVFARP